MATHGKKYTAAKQQVEDRAYALDEALPLLQKIKFAKFDETVGLSIRLGVDPKHADQMVRGTVVLPHGLGKSKRVAGDCRRRQADARPKRPAPTWSVARNWSSASAAAGWTSTRWWRRPT